MYFCLVKKYINLILIVVAVITLIVSFFFNSRNTPTFEVPLEIGSQLSPINLPNKVGENFSTEVFDGKLVLIDFWASWCRPCRMENPHLVNTYEAFKNEKFKNGNGFEIYSISLDQDRETWLATLDKDKLNWVGHVCDFNGWDSPIVVKYQVKSIPANILIDGNHKIIATNLRGDNLADKLKEQLK